MKRLLYVLLLLSPISLFGQRTAVPSLKNVSAARTSVAPKIDGLLKDSAWLQATPTSDFIINSPDYGKPATLRTEVWLLYD
ncbi:MAG: hypothetical protein ACKOA3_02835, partial [Sphingomonadales bacterium]